MIRRTNNLTSSSVDLKMLVKKCSHFPSLLYDKIKAGLGMDTFKNIILWYRIGTNESVQYFNGTLNAT